MKIINKELLNEFRRPGRCEYCGRVCKKLRDPHHLWGRGLGGGERLDVRINLMSLGFAFDCNCHGKFHNGQIKKEDLVAIVAKREGTTPEAIEEEIWRLRREPK